MKNKYFILLVWSMMVLSACSANRVLPKEVVLFPDAEAEKWWIINAIFQDDNKKDVHLSSLLRSIPAQDTYFTHFFTSLWMESDSTYYRGVQSSEEPFYHKKRRFPIRLGIPAKDSTSLQWSWKLDRKSMRLQSVVQNAEGGTLLPLIMKIKMQNDSSFNVLVSNGEPQVYYLSAALIDLRLSGNWHINSPAVLQFHVIDSGKKLLEKTKHSFISWLDISLSEGTYISLLYETDGDGNMQILNQIFWQNEHDSSNAVMSLHRNNDKPWRSPRSGKVYPLSIDMKIPEKNINLSIKPRLEAQEININKNSFWMGAVQATDDLTGAIVGNGNLYILKQ